MDTVLHPPPLDGQFLKVSYIRHGPKAPRVNKILNFFNTLENNRENNL